jgi:sigma-B regulation protein RsbU (phosphoserine phosphatase)
MTRLAFRSSGQQSLRSKLVVLCFLVSAVTTGLLAISSYERERSSILEGLDRSLRAAAAAVMYSLPPDYPDRVEANEDISAAEHETNVRRLSAFARQAGVTFVYTVARKGDHFVFSSMSATDEELEKGTWFAFASPYESPNPGFAAIFDGVDVWSGEYEDQYGRFRTVFIPTKSLGGARYVLGADVDISFVSERLNRTLQLSVLIGTLVFVVVFVASILVANRISRPLMDLARHTERLVESNFTLSDDPRNVISHGGAGGEIQQLAETLGSMQVQLAKYIEDLRATTAAKERIQSELAIAHEIQMSFLHTLFPPFPNKPGFDLHATLEPAKEVGGDLYDFCLIGEDRLFFCVGDVSGKGVPAALFMTLTQSLLKYAAQQHFSDPAAILARVNDQFCERNDSMMFVTVFCGLLDLTTGQLRYSNAGHAAPVLLREGARPERLSVPPGIALGVVPDATFSSSEIRLHPRDRLVAFTDGVSDALDEAGELYTEARLVETLATLESRDAAGTTRGIMESIAAFSKETPRADDITVLTLEFREARPGEP